MPADANPDRALSAVAQTQAGTFLRHQALAAGFTPGQIAARLASGLWVVVHPGVYCAGTTKRRRETLAVAARLYCGPKAWFSHITAARLHGIETVLAPSDVWLTVPHANRPSPRPGLTVVRSRRLESTAALVHGQPVLTRERTIIDLAQVMSRDQLARVLYDVVRRGLVTVDRVLAAAEGLGGRASLALLREVATEFSPAFESGGEVEAFRYLAEAGIVLEPQYEIWDGWFLVARLDLADPDRLLDVEIDGLAAHGSRAAQERDRRRDRELRQRGWTVLRFLVTDVRRRPAAFVAEVAQMIEALDRRQGRGDRRGA